MAQRTFTLTEAAARALLAAYHATDDGLYRTRLQAIRLHSLGYSTEHINEITGAARSSLMAWCRAYRDNGVAALAGHHLGGNSAPN